MYGKSICFVYMCVGCWKNVRWKSRECHRSAVVSFITDVHCESTPNCYVSTFHHNFALHCNFARRSFTASVNGFKLLATNSVSILQDEDSKKKKWNTFVSQARDVFE